MPQISVTISGRAYRMACGEGEEAHLEGLAALYDSKITEMRGAFGEIGDMRLHVMAAITLADELTEARRKIEELGREKDRLALLAGSTDQRVGDLEARTAEALNKASERIERIARGLNAPPSAE